MWSWEEIESKGEGAEGAVVKEEIKVEGKELTDSGTSPQLNSIDQDTTTPIPHIIELGLLDLLSLYKLLEDHNRIYH